MQYYSEKLYLWTEVLLGGHLVLDTQGLTEGGA